MNRRYSKMPPAARAKQFMPFDALKGFQEALRKKEQIPEPRKELPEDWAEELDRRLRRICSGDLVTAEYFQNGQYAKITGVISQVDLTDKVLRMEGVQIPFADISDLQGEIFAMFIDCD